MATAPTTIGTCENQIGPSFSEGSMWWRLGLNEIGCSRRAKYVLVVILSDVPGDFLIQWICGQHKRWWEQHSGYTVRVEPIPMERRRRAIHRHTPTSLVRVG